MRCALETLIIVVAGILSSAILSRIIIAVCKSLPREEDIRWEEIILLAVESPQGNLEELPLTQLERGEPGWPVPCGSIIHGIRFPGRNLFPGVRIAVGIHQIFYEGNGDKLVFSKEVLVEMGTCLDICLQRVRPLIKRPDGVDYSSIHFYVVSDDGSDSSDLADGGVLDAPEDDVD